MQQKQLRETQRKEKELETYVYDKMRKRTAPFSAWERDICKSRGYKTCEDYIKNEQPIKVGELELVPYHDKDK